MSSAGRILDAEIINNIFSIYIYYMLSANLLSNIHMLIYPDLYVKTTYLNFSQRLLLQGMRISCADTRREQPD